jgi:hypothetical protein
VQALKPIGAGQFGKVYLAEQAGQGGKVTRAVKLLRNAATAEVCVCVCVYVCVCVFVFVSLFLCFFVLFGRLSVY